MAKYVRLDEVTYPNGREVHYDYGTTAAVDDIMGRLATIGDGTNTYASYKYLGARGIVVVLRLMKLRVFAVIHAADGGVRLAPRGRNVKPPRA